MVLGEVDRAREWMRRALIIDPDNMTMRYNCACDLVVHLQDVELAIEILAPVFATMGRERLEYSKSDPDLDAIREDKRFKTMIAEAELRLAAT